MNTLTRLSVLACLLLASTASAANTVQVSTAQVKLEFTSSDVLGRTPQGQRIFSLNETLKKEFGPGCPVQLKVTPLSLVGNLLSVQLDGKICGQQQSTIRAFQLSQPPSTTVSLSAFLGEEQLVNSLRKDPYLERHWAMQGEALSELDSTLSARPFVDARGCQLGPSPASIADNNFAFWALKGNTLNVRLALPLNCGSGTQTNAFSWLGLKVAAPASLRRDLLAASLGRGFLGINRPRVSTTLSWSK